MKDKARLCILISGRGSNMRALMSAAAEADYPAFVVAVISDQPDAPGLVVAREAGIPIFIVDRKDFKNRSDFEQALRHRILATNPDLVCLAGFMRVLGNVFLNNFPVPVINIHPSLLPDYKGLNTHERVLADGIQETGCTIHYVTEELDSGEIIDQATVPILPNDTAETLAARVLDAEHRLYPAVVARLATQMLKQR